MIIKRSEKCPYCKGWHSMVIGEHQMAGYCIATGKRIIVDIERQSPYASKKKREAGRK